MFVIQALDIQLQSYLESYIVKFEIFHLGVSRHEGTKEPGFYS